MKKSIFVALSTVLMFASCSKDEPQQTTSLEVGSTCLVFPETGDAYVTTGTFAYTANLLGGGEVSVSNFVVNTIPSSFTTSSEWYSYLTKNFGCRVMKFLPESAKLNGLSYPNGDVDNIDMEFYSGQLVYISDPTDLPHRFWLMNRSYPVGRFNIGNGKYVVNTVLEQSYYKGTTVTTNMATPDDAPFQSENIAYYVNLDFSKMKAVLRIFDGKFSNSPKEPVKTMIQLNDLDITIADGTYKLTGKDVVPMIPKGETGDQSVLVPLEAFTFNNFEFVATGNLLTSCEMNYTVAGRFGGKFTGSMLPD